MKAFRSGVFQVLTGTAFACIQSHRAGIVNGRRTVFLHQDAANADLSFPVIQQLAHASQTLADRGETPCFCEKGAIKSGVTCMAGFAGARRPDPGRNTATPAAFRYPLAVSLRTPVASSMRRKDHPSAITCCFLFPGMPPRSFKKIQ